jgi:hypothetical protein
VLALSLVKSLASRAVRNDDLSCYTLYYLYRYLAAVSAVMIKITSMLLLLVVMSRFRLTNVFYTGYLGIWRLFQLLFVLSIAGSA